jgi:putative ATP-binding cassette transporter
MQARAAFGYVLDAFGWFIDSYRQLARWSATVERLWEFQRSLQCLPASPAIPCAGDALNISRLTVRHCDGSALFPLYRLPRRGVGHTLGPQRERQDHAAAYAGWSMACRIGPMGLPAGDILFLPQKAYLPQDTLRRVLSYQLAQTPDTPQLRHVLTLVGLPALYVQG